MGPQKHNELLAIGVWLGIIPGAVAILAAIVLPVVQWLAAR